MAFIAERQTSTHTKVLFVFSGRKGLQSADHICRHLQEKRWTKCLQSARRRGFVFLYKNIFTHTLHTQHTQTTDLSLPYLSLSTICHHHHRTTCHHHNQPKPLQPPPTLSQPPPPRRNRRGRMGRWVLIWGFLKRERLREERTGRRERTGEEEGGREPMGFDLGVSEDDLFHLLLRPVSSQPPPVHLRPVLVKMEVVIVEGGGDGCFDDGGGGGDVVAGGGGARVLGQMNVLKREKRSAEVRRLVDKSAWGRGEADVFGLQIFKKTNKLPGPYVCAPLRDADISAQKSFWQKNKHHLIGFCVNYGALCVLCLRFDAKLPSRRGSHWK
ncbi:hypothetical protein HanIR_Chr15g0785631 [Helianthus annuus]|nr:hypothetical protein HanIR_Chr15g0785631 [Helianthus annuus]